jgi:hypothetical protein
VLLLQEKSAHNVIDVMKLDVEGAEKIIFEDAKSWPTLCSLRCLSAELHGWVQGARESWQNFLKVCT